MKIKKINKNNSIKIFLVIFSIFVLMFVNVNSVYADSHGSSASIEPQYALPLIATEYTITVTNDWGDSINDVRITIPTGVGFSDLICGDAPTGWELVEELSTDVTCVYRTSSTSYYISAGNYEDFNLTVTTTEDDGEYEWEVQTVDTLLYASSSNPTSYVDAVGPAFDIVEPEDGTWVGMGEFTVETSVITEEGSGVSAEECDVYYVDANETEYNIGPIDYDGEICSGSVQIPPAAVEGEGTLRVEMEDNIGNPGMDSIALGFDNTPPELDYAITTSVTTIDVVFNEDIDPDSVDTSDFDVVDNNIMGVSVEGNVVTLTIEIEIATDATPLVGVIGVVTDLAGNEFEDWPIYVTALDGIAPMMDFAITGDSLEGDSSQTRAILVQFSEDIDETSVDASDFNVTNHVVDRALMFSNNVVAVVLVGNLETDETPEVEIVGDGIADSNENYITSGSIIPNDGLIPTMDVARLTTLTSIDVYFSEDLDGLTVNESDFDVEDNFVLSAVEDGGVVTLTLENQASIGDNVWLVDDVDDLFGNTLIEAGPIPCVDGVPPEVEDLTIIPEPPVTTETVTFIITFNEGMSTSTNLTVTFGLDYPYDEHEVIGNWDPTYTDVTVWVGTFEITNETGDGLNTISISDGEDLYGNVMETNIYYTFEIDTTAPEFLSVTSLDPDNVYMDGETITIIVDLGEVGLVVVGNFTEVNGQLVDAVDNLDGTYTLTTEADENEDVFPIEIAATDLAGNSAMDDSFELIVDNTSPEIEYITGNVEAEAGESVEIYANITDELSGVATVILYYTPVGGVEEESVNMTNTIGDEWYVDLPIAPDMGEIPYYIIASDFGPNSITSDTFTITVESGPVSASVSTVVADPTEMLEANGEDYSTVTVTVMDQFGNPKEGEIVYIESDRPEFDIIEPDTDTTDPNGIAEFTVSSTEGGTSTITAYVEDIELELEQTVTITFEDLILEFPSEWTVFSIPTYLTEEQISELMPVEIDQILMYDPINGYTVPTEIEPLVGYYIHNSDEESVLVAFDYMTFSGGPTPLERFLNAGWNIMGVTPLAGEDEISANDALAELLLAGHITRLSNPYNGMTYWATGSPLQFPEGLTLYLGEGHWIYTIEDGTLAGVFY